MKNKENALRSCSFFFSKPVSDFPTGYGKKDQAPQAATVVSLTPWSFFKRHCDIF